MRHSTRIRYPPKNFTNGSFLYYETSATSWQISEISSPEEVKVDLPASLEESNDIQNQDREDEIEVISHADLVDNNNSESDSELRSEVTELEKLGWTTELKYFSPIRSSTRSFNYFIGSIGYQRTPLGYFLLFLTSEIKKFFQKTFSKDGNNHNIDWSYDNLLIFIAALFRMCCNPKRGYRTYWINDPLQNDTLMKSMISRNKWESMKSSIHFGPNAIFDFMVLINDQFKKLWRCGLIVSCDESICRYRGRCKHKRYIKRKPNPWGFLFWMSIDEMKYIWDFQMWRAEHKNKKNFVSDLVMQMATSIPRSPSRMLFFDRYFGNLKNLQRLDQAGYYATMCCSKDRPSDLFKKGLHKLIDDNNFLVCRILVTSFHIHINLLLISLFRKKKQSHDHCCNF